MTDDPHRPDIDGPLTRAQQQRRTRAALVTSARRVFARDGFHAASLDKIAREAGLTKGAVYSNFDGMAALFLAVLDEGLAELEPESWNPIGRFDPLYRSGDGGEADPALTDAEEIALGFGLTGLEFIAANGRDPEMREPIYSRLGRVVAAFEPIARRHDRDDDRMSADQLASVLFVFDQGLAVLSLTGWGEVDSDTARRPMLRILRPVAGEDRQQL